MNFKPTALKIISSVVLGIATYIYLAGWVKCDSPDGCIEAVYIWPLYYAILVMIIIFIAWSLFQKRKIKSRA